MDDRHKPTMAVIYFLVFILVAAFVISGLRGQITGDVTAETCVVECYSNDNCDDEDACTLDGCAYPGSCAAKCTYYKRDSCELEE